MIILVLSLSLSLSVQLQLPLPGRGRGELAERLARPAVLGESTPDLCGLVPQRGGRLVVRGLSRDGEDREVRGPAGREQEAAEDHAVDLGGLFLLFLFVSLLYHLAYVFVCFPLAFIIICLFVLFAFVYGPRRVSLPRRPRPPGTAARPSRGSRGRLG